jgi:transcriptional regulator with XRE-family HTH domain
VDVNIALPINGVNRNCDTANSHNLGMSKDVGIRLRHVRKLRGLNQAELAKKAGVSQASVSELETGESRSPWGTNLVRLAQTLKVSPEWLASGKGQMDGYEAPLPPEALKMAKEWLRLTPEVRSRIADMITEMVKTSAAEKNHTPDERVAEAYGKPGSRKPDRNKK